jgi:hypothetical protein
MICPDGHVWQRYPTHADGQSVACAVCGKDSVTDLTSGRRVHGSTDTGFDYERLRNPQCEDDVLEAQDLMEHNDYLERNEHLRDLGIIQVKEVGPNWTRPGGNREREKKFF